MGHYVNPGNDYIASIVKRKPFVDKSDMIADLNNLFGPDDRGRVCVSRPRRFGKTLAANMISAYYSCGCDSRAIFEGLKLSKIQGWDAHLNSCNVIWVDVSEFYCGLGNGENFVCALKSALLKELACEFPNVGITAEDDFFDGLRRAYESDRRPFVVILDEYDALLRYSVGKESFDEYLNFLNVLFKGMAMSKIVQLAYITGIIPIIRNSFQSKLNNFREFTMVSPGRFARYMGFTRDEVKAVCDECGIDFAMCLDWYDGYKLNDEVDVSSPYSVTLAASEKCFESHWSATGSYYCLKDYISMDFDGIRADVIRFMNGEQLDIDISTYQNSLSDFNDKDEIFTYLVHLGYLAYNSQTHKAYIPNKEVMGEWKNSLKDNRKFSAIIDFIDNSRNLLSATIDKDAQAVAEALDYAHQEVTSSLSYNNEQSLQSAITLAYFYAKANYTVLKEMPTGRGYADVAFIPIVPSSEYPAIIIELKWNKTAKSALAQIRAKRYADALSHYKGKLILAAVTYDVKTKQHTCEFSEQEL